MTTTELAIGTRHGFTYDQWLAAAKRPKGGKRLHAAWWRGESPVRFKVRQNPIEGGGAVIVVLLSAVAGGLITYFGQKYLATKMALTDPYLIIQGQQNLADVSAPNATKFPNPTITPYTPSGSTNDPKFTASLVSFQVWVNANGPSVLAALTQAGVTAPTLPVRTDGVLDAATFDWLVLAATL